MKQFIGGAIVLITVVFASCSLLNVPDVIEGSRQQVSVNGAPTVLLTVVTFTDSTYNGSVAGVTTNTGTWTRSSETYTLNGTFLAIFGTTGAFTPAFTNSNNSLSFTDGNGDLRIYNRQ